MHTVVVEGVISRLHTTLNVIPIRDFIYHLTANFFDRCPAHPNPLTGSTGNYSLADLPPQSYTLVDLITVHIPYKHKNHELLQLAYQQLQCFIYSFFTVIISIYIFSHTVRFHLFISTYVAKLVAGTIL